MLTAQNDSLLPIISLHRRVRNQHRCRHRVRRRMQKPALARKELLCARTLRKRGALELSPSLCASDALRVLVLPSVLHSRDSHFCARRGSLAAQPRPMEVKCSGILPRLCFHAARVVLTASCSRQSHNEWARGGLYAALPSSRSTETSR